jgi:hypothetical protein
VEQKLCEFSCAKETRRRVDGLTERQGNCPLGEISRPEKCKRENIKTEQKLSLS